MPNTFRSQDTATVQHAEAVCHGHYLQYLPNYPGLFAFSAFGLSGLGGDLRAKCLNMLRIASFKTNLRAFLSKPLVRQGMLLTGIVGTTGCAELPKYEPIEVFLRTNPPLQPNTYNMGTWRSEGQRLTFSLGDYHIWEQGGADTNVPDVLVRGQELQYILRLESYSDTNPVQVDVDFVHYGDTVWSGTHRLQDVFSGFYSPGDTNATKTVRFVWN